MTPSAATVKSRAARGARFLPRVRIWRIVAAVGLIAAVAVAAVPFYRMLEGPSFIDTLVVENRTSYDIGIDVTGEDRSGWLILGTAPRDATSMFEEVIDQGDVWIFRFHAQGEEGGELRVGRSQLAEAGWRLRIPDRVSNALHASGAPFSP